MPIVVVVPASDVGPACRVARGHSGVPRVVRRERAHARRQLVANMLVCVCASAREVSVSVCTASGSISLGRSCNGRAAVGRVSLSVGLSRCRSRVCVVARAAWSCCAVICRSALERDPGLWSCRSVIVARLCIARVKAPRTTSTRPDAHTRARRHGASQRYSCKCRSRRARQLGLLLITDPMLALMLATLSMSAPPRFSRRQIALAAVTGVGTTASPRTVHAMEPDVPLDPAQLEPEAARKLLALVEGRRPSEWRCASRVDSHIYPRSGRPRLTPSCHSHCA